MPCSLSQPLICSGDQRIWRNFASILRRIGAVSLRGLPAYRLSCLSLRFRLLEPIATLTPIAAHLSAHRALTDTQNAGDTFLAGAVLGAGTNSQANAVTVLPAPEILPGQNSVRRIC
jgi:hypothetical protein